MSELSIASVLGTSMPRIKVIAAGASDLGTPEIYTEMIHKGYGDLVAFEPNREAYERLKEKSFSSSNVLYLPMAVGDGSESTLYLTNTGMTSSLFQPNYQLLERFHDLAELYQVVSEEKVKTVRLDDLEEASDADWLVMDTQGSELSIIHGAARLLSESIVVVQTEVLFVPHYIGQPLFSDIDIALRKHGFLIHSLTGIACPVMKSFPKNLTSLRTQASWTDFIYAKDFMRVGELPSRKRLALAVILHEAYRSYDLCSHVLKIHDEIEGTSFYDIYLSKL
ncbi:FkbM family methyltransferase [Synechococcus sp. B60.1]|uniref:FkbM family methyltransferase n=1 Tax=unclassified Synechococcus TaxID=2626047 RepID=UPI0039C4A5A8